MPEDVEGDGGRGEAVVEGSGTQVLYLNTTLRYLYSHLMLLYTSTPLQCRGKYYTFYSSTFIWHL